MPEAERFSRQVPDEGTPFTPGDARLGHHRGRQNGSSPTPAGDFVIVTLTRRLAPGRSKPDFILEFQRVASA